MNITQNITKRWQIGLLATILLLTLAGTAVAQDATPVATPKTVTDNDVNDIAKEVYCPVCESTPLDVCQTQACADWREVIRQKLENGESKEQVFRYFADQYGDRVLATPPREGLNWLLWIMPVAAVLIGGFFFSRFMRNLRVDKATAVENDAANDGAIPANDYVNQVEEELYKK